MKKLAALFLALILLAGCSKNPDVVKLKSGLQYADDSLGTGAVVQKGDLVTLHYSAWIIKDSSKLFTNWEKDSTCAKYSIGTSKAFNQPIKFKLDSDQFIRGSDEGIKGMKEGGKRTIIIPSYLAYGKTGIGPIPPNSNIKLVIEMVSAKKPTEAKMWNVDTSKAVTTASGLKYVIISQGSGNNPKPGDVVAVNYSAFLSNGTKFDSSVERDEPLIFTVGRGQVIKGWDEAIVLLKKGGKARFVLPPELAYGQQGVGPIPPNSTLTFDVELIDIK
jgi:peptidylprolyl isomerase